MAIKKNIWTALKRKLQGYALGITMRRIMVDDVPEGSDALAYTSKGNKIFINSNHPITNDLDEKESIMFAEGLFAHELMHQIATDFSYVHITEEKLPEFQRALFHNVFNVLEDPAIEYQSPCYFGGHLLRALSFMIMHCYKHSSEFSGRQPFTQFLAALNHYANGGLLKGTFSSPEAKKCFFAAIPIFDKAIEETDGKKRVDYALQVFNLSRELWEPIAKMAEKEKELIDEVKAMMASAGLGNLSDGEGPMNELEGEKSKAGDTVQRKNKRRKITFHIISQEEADKMGLTESSSTNSTQIPDNADLDVYIIDGKKNKTASNKEGECSCSVSNSPDVKTENSSGGEPKTSSSDSLVYENGITNEEYVISEEDARIIAETINECKSEAYKEMQEEKDSRSEALDLPEMSVHYPNATCNNVRVSCGDSVGILQESYDVLVNQMITGINSCYSQLKRIFLKDVEEREYRNRGRISIKRMSSGTLTTRLFTKKVAPGNKSDIAIILLLDESGSMQSGGKSECARLCAIGLAEVFGRLKLPMSIIGFTADTRDGKNVTHYHYLHWLNTAKERLSLLSIKARSNNFDGYSIRYATKLLLKRPEQHKLLIIISDGKPACRYYTSSMSGVKDTSDAIREAQKNVDVIGVAVGNSDTEVLHAMYKRDFLHVSKVSDLYNQIANAIKNKTKNWR